MIRRLKKDMLSFFVARTTTLMECKLCVICSTTHHFQFLFLPSLFYIFMWITGSLWVGFERKLRICYEDIWNNQVFHWFRVRRLMHHVYSETTYAWSMTMRYKLFYFWSIGSHYCLLMHLCIGVHCERFGYLRTFLKGPSWKSSRGRTRWTSSSALPTCTCRSYNSCSYASSFRTFRFSSRAPGGCSCLLRPDSWPRCPSHLFRSSSHPCSYSAYLLRFECCPSCSHYLPDWKR